MAADTPAWTARECSGMRRGGACYVQPPNLDVCTASECPKRWPPRALRGRDPIPGCSYLPGGPVPYTGEQWAALHAGSAATVHEPRTGRL